MLSPCFTLPAAAPLGRSGLLSSFSAHTLYDYTGTRHHGLKRRQLDGWGAGSGSVLCAVACRARGPAGSEPAAAGASQAPLTGFTPQLGVAGKL